MGGWYIVTKTIKGRPYLYRQRTWRDGAHVRTESHYLGPADGGVRALKPADAVRLWNTDELVGLRASDLPEREREAVRFYTDTSYEEINQILRGDRPMTDAEAERSAALLSALMRPEARLLRDLTLYRRALVREGTKVGDVFSDIGFLSCTVDFRHAIHHPYKNCEDYKSVILSINSKCGGRGYLSPNGLTLYNNEKEIIRYGGWFVVTDVVDINGETVYNIIDETEYDIR